MNITSTPQRLMTAARKFGAGAEFDGATALKISRHLWGHSVKPFREDDEWYTPQTAQKRAMVVLGRVWC